MKKISYITFFFFILTFFIMSITVLATSWVELEPQEVIDRSEVIIVGQYNFSNKSTPSGFIFQDVEFDIKNVFKGDNLKQLTVGIDYADVEWAKEFQDEGGE